MVGRIPSPKREGEETEGPSCINPSVDEPDRKSLTPTQRCRMAYRRRMLTAGGGPAKRAHTAAAAGRPEPFVEDADVEDSHAETSQSNDVAARHVVCNEDEQSQPSHVGADVADSGTDGQPQTSDAVAEVEDRQPQPSDEGADVADRGADAQPQRFDQSADVAHHLVPPAGQPYDSVLDVAKSQLRILASRRGARCRRISAKAAHVPGLRCPSHAAVSFAGRRRRMEDAVVVCAGAGYDFFAVYDGHGGPAVAEACRKRLHAVLAEEVAARGEWSRLEAEGAWEEPIAACFARVDGEVDGLRPADEEGTVGSTAVVAVVGERCIVVANCGDSRAVLSRDGCYIALSTDHKPDRPDEQRRIESAGGFVVEWDGRRVLGVLATSRSIGDHHLKPFVSAEPEITAMSRSEGDEFLILASDGLWDVVSNETACSIARLCLTGRAARYYPQLVRGRAAANAAALLMELAFSRGSSDNVSVIVVQLKNLDA